MFLVQVCIAWQSGENPWPGIRRSYGLLLALPAGYVTLCSSFTSEGPNFLMRLGQMDYRLPSTSEIVPLNSLQYSISCMVADLFSKKPIFSTACISCLHYACLPSLLNISEVKRQYVNFSLTDLSHEKNSKMDIYHLSSSSFLVFLVILTFIHKDRNNCLLYELNTSSMWFSGHEFWRTW